MDLTFNIEIKFSYTYQKPLNPALTSDSAIIQLRNELLITIENVPASAIEDGKPIIQVLWQAEKAFLDALEAEGRKSQIIMWEARLNNPEKELLSRFRVLVP